MSPQGFLHTSLDDVSNLSRGKPTRSRCGSRYIPHRLTLIERDAFEAAKRRGFLVLRPHLRENLLNVWSKWCSALNRPCMHLDRAAYDGYDQIYVNLSIKVWRSAEDHVFARSMFELGEAVGVSGKLCYADRVLVLWISHLEKRHLATIASQVIKILALAEKMLRLQKVQATSIE